MTTQNENAPRCSIVIPVRDDADGVVNLLNLIPAADYQWLEVIVNDSPHSRDSVAEVASAFGAKGLRVTVLSSNLSRAQGRVDGSRVARGDVLFHLDADMEVTPGLLTDILSRLDGGCDALVVPEVSVGTGFWARCKVLEKACWEGDVAVEAARVVTSDMYWRVGGHDPALVWGEDKDLDLRLREAGGRVDVTVAKVRHHERDIGFWRTIKKKMHYASTAGLFAAKHPGAFRDQRSLRRLPVLVWRAWSRDHDALQVGGLLMLKSGEFTAVGFVLARQRLERLRTSDLSRKIRYFR